LNFATLYLKIVPLVQSYTACDRPHMFFAMTILPTRIFNLELIFVVVRCVTAVVDCLVLLYLERVSGDLVQNIHHDV